MKRWLPALLLGLVIILPVLAQTQPGSGTAAIGTRIHTYDPGEPDCPPSASGSPWLTKVAKI